MKAKALSVRECIWESEECHLVDEIPEDLQTTSVCLPNIFRSKKVRPLTRLLTGPTYQVYYTARELLLKVLDRGAIQKLIRRAAGMRAVANRQSYNQVLQKGVTEGLNSSYDPDLTLTLDGWQGFLKRNSFQSSLVSLTRLEDGEKLEILSAFCGHIARCYQALYTPGQNLAVKKYRLFYQQGSCSLHLALLCDISSGFICNMLLYSPEHLQKQSRRTVVEQVVEHLLRPFCSQRLTVQLDSSAWMDGTLTDTFSGLGVDVHFVPTSCPVKEPGQQTPDDSPVQVSAHLQGWTGPALFPLSDQKGSGADVFLPGIWVTLHIVCINTFTLHTLQNQGSGKQVHLMEFTRTLASQLAMDSSTAVPALPRLNSISYRESSSANSSKQRTNITRAGVCGLDNSGNSCYLNAVLQCLCSTVPLVEYLLNQDTQAELAQSKCRLGGVFVQLLKKMWMGGYSSCAPVEARSVLGSILPQFNNYSQQDAQELLLFLLNVLHDDLKKVTRRQMRSSTLQQRRKQGDKRSIAAAAWETTAVSQLFEGQMSFMTLCMHCDHQAHSSQTFTVLSLPIPTDTSKCTIEDCLSLFFQQTILTGGEQMLCSVCGLRRETTVFTCLDNPPEILTLHLKRFGCKGKNQVKLRTNVLFNMKLNISPFLSSPEQNSSYSLYAVVNHTGNLNMGHYTALCQSTITGTWHHFDDSAVKEVQEDFVQSSSAYMLLYSRRLFQKPNIQGLSV
ncbi:ubiquitin carboxyl-terminal hydrolase Usp2-like isoform X3 [Takifugu rubripes]|uniref:ubiquitin carboxyl-terminal hydrolase Usp2-like isoform X3 n=1 Tax=Takifugu rubripes TaxID=31033 RepID=UPI001145B463|nr:inactive ubiquitin carboxyl-terminal hydrolase 50 isoform X3 [Takifugu rubripes]